MNTDNIQAQFNAVSEQYDRQRQALIPCFHDFYGMAVRLARQAGNVRHILDLGAGTGLMSAMLLPAFPNAHFTLADVSAQMLGKARQRFAGRPQFDFLECAFADLDLPPQSVDLAVSGLAIHHLDDEGKQQLFRRVFQWLKPNGWSMPTRCWARMPLPKPCTPPRGANTSWPIQFWTMRQKPPPSSASNWTKWRHGARRKHG